MYAKSFFKNPVLVIGILLSVIFLFQLNKKGYLTNRKLLPISCRSVLVKLDRRIPSNWETKCNDNNLHVYINFPSTNKDMALPMKNLKMLLYRDLANNMKLIAKNSPSDNLERTDFAHVRIIHPRIEINALTEGKFIVKLATLTSPKLIAEHLKVTVQIKEEIKK